jgi:hypothetical protein
VGSGGVNGVAVMAWMSCQKGEQEEGVKAKKLKPSHCGSVSGVPCETAVSSDGDGWCGC